LVVAAAAAILRIKKAHIFGLKMFDRNGIRIPLKKDLNTARYTFCFTYEEWNTDENDCKDGQGI
jgi:hypothetical protein